MILYGRGEGRRGGGHMSSHLGIHKQSNACLSLPIDKGRVSDSP